MDNYVKDNKNHHLFAFWSLLTTRKMFEEVQLKFLVIWHTHKDIDGNFGYLFKKLKEHDNYVLVTWWKCSWFHKIVSWFLNLSRKFCVTTPLLEKCEDDTHTPKMGTWESSGTPKILEFDCRGQNTSPWGVLHAIGKLLKCRCRKWPCMNHLDICSTSYGKNKG